MAEHTAIIEWNRKGDPFTSDGYSRGHRWLFDGGVEVPASSSPQVIPLPLSVEEAVDPEEAFVASLSSCHMLWFLSVAEKEGYVAETYRDEAVGVMGKDATGGLAITSVTLHPRVRFGGGLAPTAEELGRMHEAAHGRCFIARSVRSVIQVRPDLRR